MILAYMWVDPSIPVKSKVTGLRCSHYEAIEVLHRYGFNGVEIMVGNPFLFEGNGTAGSFENSGLRVTQLCTGEFFGTYGLTLNDRDYQRRKTALAWMFKTIEIASALNCSVNIGRFRGSISLDDPVGSKELMIESFQKIDQVASLYEVTILLEPLKPSVCNTLNSIAECAKLIEWLHLKQFGVMLDTDHTDLTQERESLSRVNVTYVHLADTAHAPLGRGNADFVRYFSILQEINFDGYLSVETFCERACCVEEVVSFLDTYITRTEEGVWVWKRKG